MSKKLKFSNIIANYSVFCEKLQNEGYAHKKINLTSERAVKEMFSELITDIVLFNDLINIFDYTPKEKIIILQHLNNLKYKTTTWVHMLYERNRDIFIEDEFIYNENLNDMQLFESNKIDDNTAQVEEYFEDYGVTLTPKFNLAKMAKMGGVPVEDLSVLLCNLDSEKIMKEIAKGKYNNFDIFDHSIFNDSYEEMMEDLGYGDDDDDDDDDELFESAFPIPKGELLYNKILAEATKKDNNFYTVSNWSEDELLNHEGKIIKAIDIKSYLINNDGDTELFIVMLGDDDSVSIIFDGLNKSTNITSLSQFEKITRVNNKLTIKDINLFIDKVIATDYQLDNDSPDYMGYLVIDTKNYVYNIYLDYILKHLKTFNNYMFRKHNLQCRRQDSSDVIFEHTAELNESVVKLNESYFEVGAHFIGHNFDKNNEAEFNSLSTNYLGEITLSYNQLLKSFGKPEFCNDEKTKYVWYIRFVEANYIFAIYDWKTPITNKNKKIDWQIGGVDEKFAEDYIKLFKRMF